MRHWCVYSNLGGWMLVIKGTKEQARRAGREAASGASLLPSDISESQPATQDEIDWYTGMGGRA